MHHFVQVYFVLLLVRETRNAPNFRANVSSFTFRTSFDARLAYSFIFAIRTAPCLFRPRFIVAGWTYEPSY
jgi:hypothetical protein